MSDALLQNYLAAHRQGWLPIYVADDYDAVALTEACVAAGATTIEITLRRADVVSEIERVRKQFPDLVILAGSVVGHDHLLQAIRRKRPDMPSIEQLIDMGIDGFVSMLPIPRMVIQKHCHTHLFIPGCETIGEAAEAIDAGAHFAKLFSITTYGGIGRLKLANSVATHGVLPILVTGGAKLDIIPDLVAAGASVLAGGWDLMLADLPDLAGKPVEIDAFAAAMRRFVDVMVEVRGKDHPSADATLSDADYLDRLPHAHPFGEAAAKG